MILKRVEKNGEIKAMYDSSTILASKYVKDKSELTVIFKRGAQYIYKDVPNTDYTRFELAESQGKVLNSHIKKYVFDKGDVIDSTKIESEINDLKNAEKLAMIESKKSAIFTAMKQAEMEEVAGGVTELGLNKVIDAINAYKAIINPVPENA